MQNKNYQTSDRVCVRCKVSPGVKDQQYHCTKCFQEIQGNQAKPELLSDAELQKHSDDVAKMEEVIRQKKLKEEEEKKKNFWQYQFKNPFDRGSHQQMRMLRNWNGGEQEFKYKKCCLKIQKYDKFHLNVVSLYFLIIFNIEKFCAQSLDYLLINQRNLSQDQYIISLTTMNFTKLINYSENKQLIHNEYDDEQKWCKIVVKISRKINKKSQYKTAYNKKVIQFISRSNLKVIKKQQMNENLQN
ncbi:hypothetical protein pb186bvf_019925 [Paramecium bursaria]